MQDISLNKKNQQFLNSKVIFKTKSGPTNLENFCPLKLSISSLFFIRRKEMREKNKQKK